MKKTAEDMASDQKEISVSEFFEKNKHLLGFDNPTKALMMAVKEAVDNSLDACEESGMLPDITVKIKSLDEDKYTVTVQDNGPGIVKENVPRVFGKFLYGSKFHRLRQSRGQQGLGVSAINLYAQLTTGNTMKVWSKTEKSKKTYYCELHINTMKNEPDVVKEEEMETTMEHGIKVETTILGRYRKTVEDYLKQTSIANPFAKIHYTAPDGTKTIYPRSLNEMPKQAREMKPHPYGVEFGVLQRMLKKTSSRTVQSFLTNEFSSVGAQSAKEICKVAKVDGDAKPESLDRAIIDKLLKGMQQVKIQRPPLDCLSPIGAAELEKSLKKEYPEAEFVTTITRDPEVYRGNPFQIEVGIVYGLGNQDDQVQIIRFANRVPLLYQAGACATTEAVKDIDWKRYGLGQSKNSLPTGPIILVIHMSSVWVPFISESKEAIASYPEIIKEIKLAIQDAGRRLSSYLSGKRRAGEQKRRMQIFDRYAHEVSSAIAILTSKNVKDIEKKLRDIVENKNKMKDFEVKEEVVEVTENKKTEAVKKPEDKKTDNKKSEEKKGAKK